MQNLYIKPLEISGRVPDLTAGFQGQQCFEEFQNYFLRIQNIKFCLKTLNILCLLSGRCIDHPRS